MPKLNMGIVGTGWWVEHAYLPALALCQDVTVTALWPHRAVTVTSWHRASAGK